MRHELESGPDYLGEWLEPDPDYGYTQYANRVAQSQAAPQSVFVTPAPGGFQCDGRKYCSQMTSCKEAKLFLKNCPGVEMDGNHDGVPCEQQWCTSPFAN